MRIVNIILMSGDGMRFKKAGFKTYKGLLKYNNKEIFVQSTNSLPKSENNIFIIRKYTSYNHKLKEKIKFYFPNSVIIELNQKTLGQADTLLKARKYIDDNDIINVASIDFICSVNQEELFNLLEKFDALAWVYEPTDFHYKYPNHFGWYDDSKPRPLVHCKELPITNNLKYIISGFFSFKNNYKIFNVIEDMKNKEIYINNELYLDKALNFMQPSKISFIKLKSYINLGTPEEYRAAKKSL